MVVTVVEEIGCGYKDQAKGKSLVPMSLAALLATCTSMLIVELRTAY